MNARFLILILFLIYSNIVSQWSIVDGFTFDSYGGFRKVKFWDSKIGLIVGKNGEILKSIDGGLNWTNVAVHTSLDLLDIEFVTKDTVVVVGQDPSDWWQKTGIVIFSFDGGSTWTKKYDCPNSLESVSATSSGEIYVCGSQGILSTKDLGDVWSNGPNSRFGFEEIECVKNSFVIAISTAYTDGSFIMRKNITDGTWSKLASPNLNSRWDLTADIEFINESKGWISDGFNIYTTSDSGYTWEFIKELGNQIESLSFVDNKLGYACGYSFSIYKTIDGGYNWGRYDILNSYNDLKSIQMFDSLNGICIGPNGILRTENGGGIPTGIHNSETIKNEYGLSQNYPNPFNPVTKINYTIKQSNYVKLIVYDVLGNEVEKLVNKYQVKGSHTVELDGSNLPSGVYFYKLTSGEYTETKKLILLK